MIRLNTLLGTAFNVCFLNKYDNERQHLGWHADDFPGMRADEPIAVISFGAEREIWVKPKDETGVVPPDQRFLLASGSLFLMPPGYQDTHLHRIPKHDRPCGPRISLTFRSFAMQAPAIPDLPVQLYSIDPHEWPAGTTVETVVGDESRVTFPPGVDGAAAIKQYLETPPKVRYLGNPVPAERFLDGTIFEGKEERL